MTEACLPFKCSNISFSLPWICRGRSTEQFEEHARQVDVLPGKFHIARFLLLIRFGSRCLVLIIIVNWIHVMSTCNCWIDHSPSPFSLRWCNHFMICCLHDCGTEHFSETDIACYSLHVFSKFFIYFPSILILWFDKRVTKELSLFV